MFRLIFVLFLTLCSQVSAEVNVLALAGSTREGSLNKKLINVAAEMARSLNAKVTVIDLRDYSLLFYDGDLEAKSGIPAKAKELRQLFIKSDVIFIASPEYNASVSGVLKNALDWISRNDNGGSGRNELQGKKYLLMSTSPGRGGGARGLIHLKAIIEDIGGKVYSQQFVLPGANQAFGPDGRLVDPKLNAQLYEIVKRAIS